MNNPTVVLRNKKTRKSDDRECSSERLYAVTRPRSWNEFQSNLTKFKSIQRPKKLESSSTEVKSNEHTASEEDQNFQADILRTKTKQNNGNFLKQGRPQSERLVHPSFLNKFSLLKPKQDGNNCQINRLLLQRDKTTNANFDSRLEVDVDSSSLEFETALEINPSTTITNTQTSSVKSFGNESVVNNNNVQINPTHQSKFSQISPKSSANASTVTAIEDKVDGSFFYQNASFNINTTNDLALPDKSSRSVITSFHKINFENSTDLSGSLNFESDSSSLVDTGFSSFGEPGRLQSSSSYNLHLSLKEHFFADDLPEQNLSNNVPTPLRSCYLSTRQIVSNNLNGSKASLLTSRSSSTSILEVFSDEEESFSSFETNQIKQTNDTITQSKTSTISNYISTSIKPDVLTNENAEILNKSLSKRWKDDSATLVLSRQESVQKLDCEIPLGTWPRRDQRSKRKQSRAEAEELLRKFRETSEIYRARFRSIYEEARRKVDELLFGLRVVMAKNGYNSKFYTCGAIADDDTANIA